MRQMFGCNTARVAGRLSETKSSKVRSHDNAHTCRSTSGHADSTADTVKSSLSHSTFSNMLSDSSFAKLKQPAKPTNKAAKVATKSNQPITAFLASGPHFHNLFRAFKTASDSHSPDVVTDGETVCPSEAVETLYEYSECQSRIDKRDGSNACTLISARVAHKFLATQTVVQEVISQKDCLLNCIRAGNKRYDKLPLAGFLSAEEAI